MPPKFLLALILISFKFSLPAQLQKGEIIEYSKRYIIDGNNKLTEQVFVTIQINNAAAEDLCKIRIPYSKRNKISRPEAWISDLSGKVIRKLKKDEITEKSRISDIVCMKTIILRNLP
jgi:hypothetical protein